MRAIWSFYDFKDRVSPYDISTVGSFSQKAALLLTLSVLRWIKYRSGDWTVLYLDTRMYEWYEKCRKIGLLPFSEIVWLDFEDLLYRYQIDPVHYSFPKVLVNLQQKEPYVAVDWDVVLNSNLEISTKTFTVFAPYVLDPVAEGVCRKYGLWKGLETKAVNAGLVYYANPKIAEFVNYFIVQAFTKKVLNGDELISTVVMEEAGLYGGLRMLRVPVAYWKLSCQDSLDESVEIHHLSTIKYTAGFCQKVSKLISKEGIKVSWNQRVL